jgi:hypothetical protein
VSEDEQRSSLAGTSQRPFKPDAGRHHRREAVGCKINPVDSRAVVQSSGRVQAVPDGPEPAQRGDLIRRPLDLPNHPQTLAGLLQIERQKRVFDDGRQRCGRLQPDQRLAPIDKAGEQRSAAIRRLRVDIQARFKASRNQVRAGLEQIARDAVEVKGGVRGGNRSGVHERRHVNFGKG